MRTLPFAVLLLGCGSTMVPSPGTDAGFDAGTDAGLDAGPPPPLPACAPDTPESLMGCVERARYVTDLEAVEGARSPSDAHHDEVRDMIATRLEALGLTVERHDYGTGVNVIGTLAGTSDERVLVSAHYDHIPDCPGADDNGSGVAGALEVARVLAMATHDRTLVVAFWDEEERGLVGSEAYANRHATTGEPLVANLVFEMIGYRDETPNSQSFPDGFELLFPRQIRQIQANQMRGDFILLIADELHSTASVEAYQRMAARVSLPAIALVLDDGNKRSPLLGDLRRSDHAPFWALDEPGVMIGDTANFRYARYHCGAGADTSDHLDPDFSVQVIQATVGAAAELLANP
ncbi:MAG: M20/M25/M40 family metallo-hydrolase [Sandaracinaceae bacterium]|nr:M20/M25/M40 family metallo-hydrolase [Sandaracinaceae bacterium]